MDSKKSSRFFRYRKVRPVRLIYSVLQNARSPQNHMNSGKQKEVSKRIETSERN